LALALIVVAIPVVLIGQRNQFFARLWEYWTEKKSIPADYLSYLGFDARLVYSEAAFNTYNTYPILGVGLGNYAFYFEEMLPYRSLSNIPEILMQITPEMGRDRLVTAKNFYLRILAETGVFGAATFIAFLIANLGCALYLYLSPDKEWKYWGTASLCGLIAFGLSAFTFDSFVIPNMWVVFGMIAAATRVHSYECQTRKS
jgi:O-antigen ligase